jgi:hypothetical protein
MVNGGSAGNQVISVGVLGTQGNVLASNYVHSILGLPGIPSNTWTKVAIIFLCYFN